MTEWFMVPVLKTGECKKLREFESHPFRHLLIAFGLFLLAYASNPPFYLVYFKYSCGTVAQLVRA